MSKPKIMICGDIVWAHKDVEELLGPIADVVLMDSTSRENFLENLKPGKKYADIVGIYRHNTSADSIGIFDAGTISALAKSGTLKWIAHNGAGYDQIDVRACAQHNIRVSNTPGAVDDATATTALYLIIATVRQYTIGERNLREGKWKSGLTPAHDPASRTLAILGMGGIGTRLAEMAHALNMKILYHNRKPAPGAPSWAEYFSAERLDEMLSQTDILSVHVPLRKETEGLVGEKMIRALKKGAIIVNTARGKVIDEDAMIRALEDGQLSSVGLDVYPDEPAVNPRLLEFPRITLLPHLGTETEESQHKMEVRALTNLRDFLQHGQGKDIVPELKGKL